MVISSCITRLLYSRENEERQRKKGNWSDLAEGRLRTTHKTLLTIQMDQRSQRIERTADHQNKIKKVIACSDSLSVLVSLQSMSSHSRADILSEIYETLY